MSIFCKSTLLGIALLLVSCGQAPAPAPEIPATPAVAPPALLPFPQRSVEGLAGFSTARVILRNSQRDALLLPAGSTHIDLDAGPDAAFLRASLLPSEGATISASIYQEAHGVAMPAATDAAQWTQHSVVIKPGTRVSLVLHSEKPFHLAACGVVAKTPARPDVLVYLIDTLRKDHLGCYRYPLDTSPNIDAFAKEATLFRELTPMSSWTRSSVASLLTGTMDYTHHALSAQDRLRAGLPSLAHTLARGGWETRSIIANPAISSGFGFGVDFQWNEDLWQDYDPPGWDGDVAAVDLALDTLAGAHGQPLFLYLHTMAPHRDYAAPPEFEKRFLPDRFVGTTQQVSVMEDLAAYDAEIAFSDAQFARVLQALKAAGRYDNTLIVVLSDHGEQFMEHGELAHANSLHFAELGVPLLVKLPGNIRAKVAVRDMVQMVDLAPTVIDALGLTVPPSMEGRSLLPLIKLDKPFVPQPSFARLRFGERHYYMAQTQDLKYLYDVVRGESTWYDRVNDSGELFPLRQPPKDGEALKAFADAIAAKPVPAAGETSPPLSPEETQDLTALGYL